MTTPTLAQGLEGIDPVQRATLTHVLVQVDPAHADCYRDKERVLGGPIATDDVHGQVLEVLAAGLMGTAATVRTATSWAGWIIEPAPDYREAAALIATHLDGQTLRLLEQHRTSTIAAARAREIAIRDGLPAAALDAIAPSTISEPAPPAENPTRTSSAPQAEHVDPSAAPLVRMKMGHTKPCVVCSTPAREELLGRPVHGGYCQTRLRADLAEGHIEEEEPARAAGAQIPDEDGEPARPPRSPSASDQPKSAATKGYRRGSPGPSLTTDQARQRGNEKGRWTAPAAALTEQLHLPGGIVHDWQADHLGELAMLTKTHELGWGGGARRPDPGELWLYPQALERLGLPETLNLPEGGPKAERDAIRTEIFEALNDLPAVADAIVDGWKLGQGGKMGPRTRISHPTLLPGGALLEILSWSDVAGVPLLARGLGGNDFRELVEPEVLPDRLLAFAAAAGLTYRVSPAITGLDLVDNTKPPREPDAPIQPGTKSTVKRWTPAELPKFKRDTSDTRFTLIEHNFSWHRRWEDLSAEVKAMPYAIAYDHGIHFLNPWISTQLGVEGLQHHTGPAAAWDGTEKPAYFKVDKWAPGDRTIPDPIEAASGFDEDGRAIVTCHTLRQLQMIDPLLADSVVIHESWTWDCAPKYLAQAGAILRDARYGPDPFVAETAKMIYSATTQKLASVEHNPAYHLWRPDWRDMIMGAARTAMMALIVSVRDTTGITPLVVDRDTVIYPSASPDPQQGWPGKPEKYGKGPGQWKPIGVADLHQWGPSALAGSGSIWHYAKHIRAMNLNDQGCQSSKRG